MSSQVGVRRRDGSRDLRASLVAVEACRQARDFRRRHTLAYDGTIMGKTMSGHPLPRGKWDSVTVPTLVMDGGASPAWMRNAVQALVDVLPCAQRCTLEDQTHVVSPEALAPILIAFFNG